MATPLTVEAPPAPTPLNRRRTNFDEVCGMQYTLKLVKVGGMTRWAVHDGRKVIGTPFETYGQAAAERSKIEAKERLSETDRATR